MSKFKRELDAVTPREQLKENVRAAVSGASVQKKLAPKRFLGISTQSLAALAATVMIVSLLVVSFVFGGGGGAGGNGNLDLRSFNSVAELREYIQNFNSNRNYNTGGSDGGALEDATCDEAGPSAPSDNNEHSTTNNQVQGVAESDIVHTDGNYIYTLSYYNLTIINAQSLSVVVNIKYDNFSPDSMFLLKNKGLLIVIGGEYEYSVRNFSGGPTIAVDAAYCYWYSNTTVVKVYEIDTLLEGRNETVREMKFANAYLNTARMINGNLYLVLSAYNYYSSDEIWIPTVYDSRTGETNELPMANIFASPNNGDSMCFTLLAAVDVTKNEAASVNAYLGSSGTVYASTKGFYITFTKYEYSNYTATTTILRFEIDGIKLNYAGGGLAEGTLVNQFAMDEYTYSSYPYKNKTYFRIATTLWDNSESRITVFNSSMEKVGELKGLGEEGERIFSVRFNGEKAVVVTFMQMDPLYVIDLSVPSAPSIISALKIPGVSDYLHFLTVKDDYVFAVGRRQSQSGTWLDGLKVSLFDISGTQAAREIAYFNVGSDYSYGEATYNHKAIMYFKPSSADFEVFAFAATSYDIIKQNGWYIYTSNSNLYYYTASADGLKQEVLKYNTADIITSYANNYYSYYQDSIRRSVIIGGYVYLIGSYGIERYNTASFNGNGNYASEYVEIEVDTRY